MFRNHLNGGLGTLGLIAIAASARSQTTYNEPTSGDSSWFDLTYWSAGLPNSSTAAILVPSGQTIYFGDFRSSSGTILGGAASAQSLTISSNRDIATVLDLGANFTGGNFGALTISQDLNTSGLPLTIQNGSVSVGGNLTGDYFQTTTIGGGSGSGIAHLKVAGTVQGEVQIQKGSSLQAGGIAYATSYLGQSPINNNGALILQGNQTFSYGYVSTQSGATTNVNGNLLLVNSGGLQGNGGATHVAGDLTVNNGQANFQQGSNLVVDGKTAIESGNSIFTGASTFSKGLVVDGSASAILGGTITGNVSETASATPNAYGVQFGVVSANLIGNLENAAVLTIDQANSNKIHGNLVLDSTSQNIFDFGSNPLADHTLDVTGSTTLGGALGIKSTKTGTYSVDLIHSSGPITGRFDLTVPEAGIDIESITYDPHDVCVKFKESTPEPAPFLLFALGAGAILIRKPHLRKHLRLSRGVLACLSK